MGWIGVITNAGAAMIAQLAGGSHTLTITKATIGTGTVAEANLRTQTALTGEVGEISIVSKKDITGGVKIRLRVLAAATTGYTAHQIGVWGKIDSGTAELIMLHQDSGAGIAIPTEAESPEFVFDYIAALAVSNTEDLEVTVDPGVYATMGEIDDLEGEIDGKADPSVALSLTAEASDWSNTTPPTMTLTATGVTATNNILVGAGSMTSSQREAFIAAQIACTAQGNGTITLTCYEEKPEIDLPITVIILG